MKTTFYDFCRTNGRSELLEQWDEARNLPLTPADVSHGSHRKVWWRCSLGHGWEAMVKVRAAGAGCPVCTHRKLLTGFNDLATLYPDQAREWDLEKNAPLTPDQVQPGSAKKAWWKCGKGHMWQAVINSRTGGDCGCPYCTGKQVIPGETDLVTTFPEIAAQWHPDKNGALTPTQVSPNSNRPVWWVCEKGHEWKAPAARRTRINTGCPYCAGRKVLAGFNDLQTLEPLVAAQWDQESNGSLTPAMVTAGSTKRVWWRCEEGHVWSAKVYSRTGRQKNGCPVCAGMVKKTFAYRYQTAENWQAGKALK